MDESKWLEVAVNTTPDRLDQVCAKLAAAGMDSLVIEDEQDFLSFLEQNRQYWDYVDQELLDRMKGVTRVKFYVTDDEDGKKQLEQYTRGLDQEFTATPLTDNDWAYSWQKYYKPLEIGARLYVVPQWMREEPVPAGRVPFYLNPGLTFGTGSHASTQLCLEGVEEHTVSGCDVLDLCCCSGILSIAAMCLGAKHAVAVYIDPKAVDVAYENAALNERVTVTLDPGLTFGTGSHATTRLCLTALERAVHGGERVLDLGCGSGILSIAALKLGAAAARAVDIDPMCLDVAYENAALNGIGRDRYTVRAGNVLADRALAAELAQKRYHLVLANIVADVIIPLAPLVRGFLKAGGVFICSGIIDGRAAEVAERLRGAGLELLETQERKGWYAYVCR